MGVITFLSDFGKTDFYVAAVKAKVLAALPRQPIVDISHDISPTNIMQAAFVLQNVFRDFPDGSIHIVSVKSEVNAKEAAIAIRSGTHWFLGTDNGLLGLVVGDKPDEQYQLSTVEDLFPARNSLANAAISLVQDGKIKEATPIDKIKRFIFPAARASKEQILGQVIHIDHYGNLICNIERKEFEFLSEGKSFLLQVGRYQLRQINKRYAESGGGDIFAVFNSIGMLEVGIYEGDASQLLGLDLGSNILIKFQ